jgi:nicotinate-nucleotide adenylyltransferase
VTINPWGDRRRRRIGLLGGSFNPAHEGHLHVARVVRRALRLDEVWLMVSPGNPLKPRAGMAPFAERLASARRIADGRRIIACGIEARLGTRYSIATLAALRRRFPRSRFVFVIGADNLVQLPRWQGWTRLVARNPIAVLPRPGWTRRALAGKAAHRMARHRRRPPALLSGALPSGALMSGSRPAHAPWSFVPATEHAASATAIRAAMRAA